MCLHVDLQVVAPGESSFAVRASVSSISRVEFHVSISAAFVLEQSGTPAASIRHLIAVTLFVFFQVTQSWKGSIAELARIRRSGVVSIDVDADVGVDLGFRWKAGRRRRRARRWRLSSASRVRPAILAVPGRTSGTQGFFGFLSFLLRRFFVSLDLSYQQFQFRTVPLEQHFGSVWSTRVPK